VVVALHRCDHRWYDWPPGKAGFQVTATSGSLVDPNAARCTNGSLTYTLTLSDSTKATVDATTAGRVCLADTRVSFPNGTPWQRTSEGQTTFS